jgi:hypothetical protein
MKCKLKTGTFPVLQHHPLEICKKKRSVDPAHADIKSARQVSGPACPGSFTSLVNLTRLDLHYLR